MKRTHFWSHNKTVKVKQILTDG